jgi:AcrR family transcriptional regulator
MSPVREPVPDKRAAILAAALELFAERGFHGTTVPEVAAKAGVGAGTLYRYFESKEALVNALYQHWKGAYARLLMTDLPLGGPHRVVFQEIWRRMGMFARKHTKAMDFLELHHHGSYLDETSRQVEWSLLDPIREFVKDAQRQRILKKGSPEVLMSVVYGAFVGLVRAASSGYLELTPKVLEEAETCVWEAVRS